LHLVANDEDLFWRERSRGHRFFEGVTWLASSKMTTSKKFVNWQRIRKRSEGSSAQTGFKSLQHQSGIARRPDPGWTENRIVLLNFML